jgi:hypothetical protein
MAELVDGVQVDCCLENDDLMVRFPEMALHKVRFEGRYRLAIRDTPGADSERCRLDQQSDVRYALVNPDTEDVLAVMLFKSPDRIIRDLKLDTPVYFQLIEVAEG